MTITEEKKQNYINLVFEELKHRGFSSEAIPKIIAKTGFMTVMEKYPEEQMHDSIKDTVNEIIVTALQSFAT